MNPTHVSRPGEYPLGARMTQRNPYGSIVAVLLTLALLLSGGVLLLEAVPVRATAVNASGSASVQVSALPSGYAFSPATIENVASNTSVSFTFTNLGALAHTFTIYGKEGVEIPTGTDPGTVFKMVYESGVKPLVNLNLSTGNGAQNSTTITAPAPGWYEFLCMESGHFGLGMYGFIAFGEPLPSYLSVTTPNTSPGAAVFIIVGTIVTLVIIAIVLGFVVGRRRGSHDEMPPERLGYAEPPIPAPPPAPPLARSPPKG